MAKTIGETLCNLLRTGKVSIQLNESTSPNNEALLFSFVRFIKYENIVSKEPLFEGEV